MRIGVTALLLLASAAWAAAPATLAVVNARIWTGNPKQPWASAIAAAGDRILAVGTDEEIRAVAGNGTRIVDARGGTVTPGFIDSHIHLFSFDRNTPARAIFMRYLRTREEAASRISGYAGSLPPGTWILGYDWIGALWGRALPTRQWLDRVAPNHPVWLVRLDGAAGLANSAALRASGIGNAPEGEVRGDGMWAIEAAIAGRTRERDDAVVEKGLRELARAGITSVHHNNSWYDMIVLDRLYRAGRLPVRVYASPPLPGWERLRDHIAAHGRGDNWLHWGAVKGYGAIQEADYYRWVSGASRAGLQVMVHVGSTAELHTLLTVFERVRAEQGLRDPRFRVEHAHDMPASEIALMARAGALASWQPPLLAHTDLRTAAGEPPPLNLFPCRAMLQAGVRIAFGTDSSPWLNGAFPTLESLQMALERAAPDGTRLTLDEALRAYTVDAAWAEFMEKEKGSLEPGKLADFVVFDRDFTSLPVSRIREARVRMTVIGGRDATASLP